MKKTILTSLFAGMVCVAANASDGGLYTETETYTNSVRYNTNVVMYAPVEQPRRAVAYTCNSCAQPVRVKTHTEVIDHYQVYRPVTVYEPAGTYAERRVVRNNTCNRCDY
ncbi:MAG: hypothetical protein J6T57_02635 [Alphaproteobacteria bacterium]|nr:hypothetical protein [Alphaproteobacteria bacterium]